MEIVSEPRWKVWLQLLLGVSLTFLFFYMMSGFLVAILLGAVLAIVCYPPFCNLREKMPRPLAALFLTGAVTLGILLPLVAVLYTAAYYLVEIIGRLKIPKDRQSIDLLLYHPIINKALAGVSSFLPVDREWVKGQALDVFQGVIERLSALVGSFFTGMPGLLLAFFVAIISLYFFLVDGARFLRFLTHLSPLPPDRSKELYSAFESSCRGVVLGIFVSGLVQGILMAILFSVAGLANPLLIGVVTIVLGMVPVVGSAPMWIGATLYLFLYGKVFLGVMMAVGGVIISTSDNIVRP